MAPLREAGLSLLSPFLAPRVSSCSPGVAIRHGDNAYWMYCASPQLFFDVAGSGSAELGYCFPQAYFLWTQNYVREALRYKPSTGSAKAKVLWALDVWSHIVYGLLSLNIDLRSGMLYQPGVDNYFAPAQGRGITTHWAHPVYRAFRDAQYHRIKQNVQFLKVSEKPTLRTEQEKEWADSVMMPTPFFELPFDWISQLDTTAKDPNQLWDLFYSAVLPWEVDGLRLLSESGKDSAEVSAALAQNDAPLVQGLYQWRLWSLQDWSSRPRYVTTPLGNSAGDWDAWWPLDMGVRNDTVTLGTYIQRVANERGLLTWRSATVSRLYPTLQVTLENMEGLTTPFLKLSYAGALKQHVALWTGKTVEQNSFGYAAITSTDSNALIKGQADLVQAQTEAATNMCGNPTQAQQMQSASPEVQKLSTRVQTMTCNSPARPLLDQLGKLMNKLVVAVGAATGGAPQWPILPNPFVRSLSDPAWNTEASGPTAATVARIFYAIKNIEVATGIDMGFYAEEWQPGSAAPTRQCSVVFDVDGNPHSKCEDVGGDSGWGAVAILACRAAFDKFSKKYRGCLTELDYPAFEQACLVRDPSAMTPEAFFDAWAREVLLNRACTSQSLWGAFVSGFAQRGNPFPSSTVVDSAFDALNPATRWIKR